MQKSPVEFAHPDIIKYDHDCYTIRGRDQYVYSAAFHYFRCPQPLWRDRLTKLRQAGYRCIDIYIPWNWHERVEGEMDLRELEAILRLASEMDMYVIARPGPYICSEWDAGGFPRWLAAKRVGYRSDSDASIEWSKHWFDAVMEVIKAYEITRGGSVIMVQLENEYDFSGKPDAEMAAYIKALYRMTRETGVEIPLMTCCTRVARNNDDPDMQQIMDSYNFYTAWHNIHPYVGNELKRLEEQEPYAQRMVTELQGGWFTRFGTPFHEYDLGANQINALTKTCIENGVTISNHYMAFGGTNFGYWGSREMTTTYDYHAPLREPGGLWEKYYSAKLIGDFCNTFSELIARAHVVESAAGTDEENVSVSQRMNGDAGFVFVRNHSNESKWPAITATDPRTGRKLMLRPYLAPLDMKILPINVKAGDAEILATNAEVQSINQAGDRTVIVLYADKYLPTDAIEIDLKIDGRKKRIRLGVTDVDSVKSIGSVTLVGTARARAGRTWNAFGGTAISDAYLIEPTDEGARVSTQPGRCRVRAFVPGVPKTVRTAGKDASFSYDPKTSSVRFEIKTPQIPAKEMRIAEAAAAPDPFDAGQWRKMSLEPLDDLGIHDNGYTRFRTEFDAEEPGILMLGSHGADPGLVFVNGRISGWGATFPALHKIRSGGKTEVDVYYENAGRPNHGAAMEELKGVSYAAFMPQKSLKKINFTRFRFAKSTWVGDQHEYAKAAADDSGFPEIDAGDGFQPEMENFIGWGWYRARFNLPENVGNVTVVFEGVADGCWVYLNDKQIGGSSIGSAEFTCNGTDAAKPGENVLSVAVQNLHGSAGIHKPVYILYAADGVRHLADWEISPGLGGETQRYHEPGFDDSSWQRVRLNSRVADKRSGKDALVDSALWYRLRFSLPQTDGWQIPWKLKLDAAGEALIYLNGELLGKFTDRGPQTDYYLPEPWLKFGDRQENVVAIAIRAAANRPIVRKASVAPYEEFSVKVNDVEVEF